MSYSKKDMNNAMEGGYYAPLLSSSIMTTLLGLAAFFFLRKRAKKDKKMSGHECSNLKECLKRRVNLYHILGLTANDVNSRPEKIKSKIRQVQPLNIPPICKPLFDVAYGILTNPQKKASYDIVFEILEDQFKFPETPDTFRNICQQELQRIQGTTPQTAQQPTPSAPPLQQIPQTPQTQQQSQQQSQQQKLRPQRPQSQPHEQLEKPPLPPRPQSQPHEQVEKPPSPPSDVQQSTGQSPIQVMNELVNFPENEKPHQGGGYTHNDKIYHQKYLKYKQKYMQLVNELTY